MNCKNCNTEVVEHFCSNCGQAVKLKRIDGHYIRHEIEHILHVEKGIFYTIKELIIRPGQSMNNYIHENRSRLVKPVLFIIITSLIYSFITHFFHVQEIVQHSGLEKMAVIKMLGWLQANYGYFNIITGAFIAIWLNIFFKKQGYNFYEVLIMLCFVLGISMLIFAVCALIQGITHIQLFTFAGIIGVVYVIWATGNFFGKNKIANYLKSLASYLLGMITFFICLFATGMVIDLMLKK